MHDGIYCKSVETFKCKSELYKELSYIFEMDFCMNRKILSLFGVCKKVSSKSIMLYRFFKHFFEITDNLCILKAKNLKICLGFENLY